MMKCVRFLKLRHVKIKAIADEHKLLTSANYESWKSYMKTKLSDENHFNSHLWFYLTGSQRGTWFHPGEDKEVLIQIQMACSQEMLPHILYAQFATEAWEWLREAVAASTEEKERHHKMIKTATAAREKANEVPEVDKVLTRRNYRKWKNYMKNQLLSKYLWNVVDGSEPIGSRAYNMKNHIALITIRTSCGEEMFNHIYEVDHAREAWLKLAEELGGATGTCIIERINGIDNDGMANVPSTSVSEIIDHELLTLSFEHTNYRDIKSNGNYQSWKGYMQTYLINQGLWGFMEESVISDHVKDEEALDAIKLSCGPEMLGYILYMDCAKHAWEKLAQVGSRVREHENHCRQVREAAVYKARLVRFPEAYKDLTRTDDWDKWEYYINEALESHSIRLGYNVEPPSYVASNACAIRILKEACGADMLPYLYRTNTAREVIEILKEVYHTEEKDRYLKYSRLLHAVQNNDFGEQVRDLSDESWRGVHNFFRHFPEALTAGITEDGFTALHVAVRLGRVDFVKELLKLMSPEQLKTPTYQGNTAIGVAARGNNMEIVQMMAKASPELLDTPNCHGYNALTIAAINGNEIMFRYLYGETSIKDIIDKGFLWDERLNFATLITSTARFDAFDIVLDFLDKLPAYALLKDAYGMTLLTVMAGKPSAFPSGNKLRFLKRCINQLVPGVIQPLDDSKEKYHQSLAIIKKLSSRLPDMKPDELKENLIFDAIHESTINGIVEIFENLTDTNPYIERYTDENKRGLFQIAIMSRQENIFQYMCAMGQRNQGMDIIDNFGNNALHCVGFWDPSPQLDKIQGPALQMQRELQWLQEVERVVPPRFKEMKNKDNLTPGALFSLHHKDLAEKGEKWMRDTAQACMLVTTLIATVMFAAAFTLPGGSDPATGLPLSAGTVPFKVFIISDAVSLFSACTSVLMFFSLLTARYAEPDFLTSLPKRLIFGLLTLFISIVTMMATFAATLVIVFRKEASWVYIPITTLAIIPVLLFSLLQFPLFVNVVASTYGRGIFREPRKRGVLPKPVYSGGHKDRSSRAQESEISESENADLLDVVIN